MPSRFQRWLGSSLFRINLSKKKPERKPSDAEIVEWLRNPDNRATQLMKAAINEWSAENVNNWGVPEGAVNPAMLDYQLQAIDVLQGLHDMVVEDKAAIPFFAVDFLESIDAAKQAMIAMVSEEYRFLLIRAADRGKIQGLPKEFAEVAAVGKTINWKTVAR
jgi:hypothetical protein